MKGPPVVHQIEDDKLNAFRDEWFSMVLCDEASFYQIMSTVRFHYGKLYGRPNEEGEQQAAKYNSKAIQSVNSRLSNSAQNTSKGIIGAVISFLTYNVSMLSFVMSVETNKISILYKTLKHIQPTKLV
jgi:hypothetical protein